MQVRCLHCHEPTEVANDSDLGQIVCTSCGGSFSIVPERTTPYHGPRKLGRFDLLEQVGAGAFGAVWKARDPELDRIVAVKIPRKHQLPAHEAEMFLREARAAAQLKHPSIVSVHEVGRDADNVYIVSDFVQGATLDDWLASQRLTPREAADLCAQLADALEHAHQAGVIHRDLKPSNVMMDLEGRPHLMDFGLARRTAGEATMTVAGRILGTPAYMSPEQARGEAHTADCRTDVYSLGVILFKLLTGELPFRGSAQMLALQILRDEPPNPRKLNHAIPRDLETICLKAMAKEPARRYQTAEEVASDLRRFLKGEPIHARPVGRGERVRRWCRRNPMVAGLTAALAIAIVAGFTLVTIFWLRARADFHEAEAQRQLARKNFQKARDAVEQMLTRVAESRLVGVPQFDEERRALLEEALKFYQDAAAELGQDPTLRHEAAVASRRMGDIEMNLGRHERAEAAYRETITRLQALLKEDPGNLTFQADLARTQVGLGELYRDVGRNTEAEGLCRQALDQFDHVRRHDPTDQRLRRAHNAAWNAYALAIQASGGRHPEAEAAFRNAIAISEPLVRETPNDPKNAINLSKQYSNLAVICRDTNRFDDADRLFRQGLAIKQQLVQDHPKDPDYRYNLAGSHVYLGTLAHRRRDSTAALEHLRQATDLYQDLVRDHPSVPNYRADLAGSMLNQAVAKEAMNHFEEAESDCAKGLAIFEKLASDYPQVPDHRVAVAKAAGLLGQIHLRSGKAEQAALAYENSIRMLDQVKHGAANVALMLQSADGLANTVLKLLGAGQPDEALKHANFLVLFLEGARDWGGEVGNAKRALMRGYSIRGEILTRLNQHAEAIRDWDRAHSLAPERLQPEFRLQRVLSMARMKDPVGALKNAPKLSDLPASGADRLYELARVYALAAGAVVNDPDRANEHVSAAMKTLATAVARGFKDGQRMKHDPDLATLRTRDDFQELLRKLEE